MKHTYAVELVNAGGVGFFNTFVAEFARRGDANAVARALALALRKTTSCDLKTCVQVREYRLAESAYELKNCEAPTKILLEMACYDEHIDGEVYAEEKDDTYEYDNDNSEDKGWTDTYPDTQD